MSGQWLAGQSKRMQKQLFAQDCASGCPEQDKRWWGSRSDPKKTPLAVLSRTPPAEEEKDGKNPTRFGRREGECA